MHEFNYISAIFLEASNQNIPRFEQNLQKLLQLTFDASKSFDSFEEYYEYIMALKD
jgi:hypothetical protein